MRTRKITNETAAQDDESITTKDVLQEEVYARTGKRVGKVEDIVVDFDSQTIDGLLITDVNEELFTQSSIPDSFIIPYSWVQDADSIVLTVPISAERVDFNE